MITQKIGQAAEEKALAHLCEKGLKLVLRNYRCLVGEIDLIMRDREYLVFVEVRARAQSTYGGALESITYAKQKKIIKATSHYLMAKRLYDTVPVRFDVVILDGFNSLIWIKDAFNIDY